MNEAGSPTLAVVTVIKNERQNLEPFLRSIEGIADELVVVDTGSTDGTLEMLRVYADSAPMHVGIVERTFQPFHHGKAKNLSIDSARSEYALVLDADERLGAECRSGLKAFLKSQRPPAVSLPRIDELVPHLIDNQVRVFLRGQTGGYYQESPEAIVHCNYEGSAIPVLFDGPILHIQGQKHWLRHPTRFLPQLRLEASTIPNTRGLLREVVRGVLAFYFKFKKTYITQQAYKDGWNGFAFAVVRGMYGFLLHVSVGLKPKYVKTSRH